MDDLSSKERLAVNALSKDDAEFQEPTRRIPIEKVDLSDRQIENGESNPNREVRSPIPARDAELATRLFSAGEAGTLRSRWESIQVGFVDEPKRSVKEADQLVGEVISQLAKGVSAERQRLDRGDQVSTEDLRCSFRRYRSIFERLLSI